MAVCEAEVLTVSVSVTGPLPAVIAILGGANEQDTCAGSFPQEKVTVPVKSPAGVRVMVNLPELPDLIVSVPGFTDAETDGVTTVSVSAVDVLIIELVLPPYTAVMLYTPVVANEAWMEALPVPSSIAIPITVVPPL